LEVPIESKSSYWILNFKVVIGGRGTIVDGYAKLSCVITDLIAQEERMTHGIVATNYRPQ